MTRQQLIDEINNCASQYLGFQTSVRLGSRSKPALEATLKDAQRMVALKRQADAVAGDDEYTSLWLQANDIWLSL